MTGKTLARLGVLAGAAALVFGVAAPASASNGWAGGHAAAVASNAWAVSPAQAGSKWWAPPAAAPIPAVTNGYTKSGGCTIGKLGISRSSVVTFQRSTDRVAQPYLARPVSFNWSSSARIAISDLITYWREKDGTILASHNWGASPLTGSHNWGNLPYSGVDDFNNVHAYMQESFFTSDGSVCVINIGA
jgi:hypothetical protein